MTRSPSSCSEFRHENVSGVRDATIFRTSPSRLANGASSPPAASRSGQAPAKLSYVTLDGPLQASPDPPTVKGAVEVNMRPPLFVTPTTAPIPLPPAIATPASTSMTSVKLFDGGGKAPASPGNKAAMTSNECRPGPSASPSEMDPSPPSGLACVALPHPAPLAERK